MEIVWKQSAWIQIRSCVLSRYLYRERRKFSCRLQKTGKERSEDSLRAFRVKHVESHCESHSTRCVTAGMNLIRELAFAVIPMSAIRAAPLLKHCSRSKHAVTRKHAKMIKAKQGYCARVEHDWSRLVSATSAAPPSPETLTLTGTRVGNRKLSRPRIVPRRGSRSQPPSIAPSHYAFARCAGGFLAVFVTNGRSI